LTNNIDERHQDGHPAANHGNIVNKQQWMMNPRRNRLKNPLK
jgi:hypothetical protein